MPETLSGKCPINSLKLTSNTVTSFNNPISSGTQDLNPLFIIIISFNVFDMLPILAGRHPSNLLCPNTITDTGELPKLSGISNMNRLWFIKTASISLSNSSLGTPPSNSLNRISKNFNFGNLRTT
ncbi:hypothetical protein Hdeb2414_s0571g00918451 [Helianthus debilis subsp. tardiflorus]